MDNRFGVGCGCCESSGLLCSEYISNPNNYGVYLLNTEANKKFDIKIFDSNEIESTGHFARKLNNPIIVPYYIGSVETSSPSIQYKIENKQDKGVGISKPCRKISLTITKPSPDYEIIYSYCILKNSTIENDKNSFLARIFTCFDRVISQNNKIVDYFLFSPMIKSGDDIYVMNGFAKSENSIWKASPSISQSPSLCGFYNTKNGNYNPELFDIENLQFGFCVGFAVHPNKKGIVKVKIDNMTMSIYLAKDTDKDCDIENLVLDGEIDYSTPLDINVKHKTNNIDIVGNKINQKIGAKAPSFQIDIKHQLAAAEIAKIGFCVDTNINALSRDGCEYFNYKLISMSAGSVERYSYVDGIAYQICRNSTLQWTYLPLIKINNKYYIYIYYSKDNRNGYETDYSLGTLGGYALQDIYGDSINSFTSLVRCQRFSYPVYRDPVYPKYVLPENFDNFNQLGYVPVLAELNSFPDININTTIYTGANANAFMEVSLDLTPVRISTIKDAVGELSLYFYLWGYGSLGLGDKTLKMETSLLLDNIKVYHENPVYHSNSRDYRDTTRVYPFDYSISFENFVCSATGGWPHHNSVMNAYTDVMNSIYIFKPEATFNYSDINYASINNRTQSYIIDKTITYGGASRTMRLRRDIASYIIPTFDGGSCVYFSSSIQGYLLTSIGEIEYHFGYFLFDNKNGLSQNAKNNCMPYQIEWELVLASQGKGLEISGGTVTYSGPL